MTGAFIEAELADVKKPGRCGIAVIFLVVRSLL
jgi:hypothetical protein